MFTFIRLVVIRMVVAMHYMSNSLTGGRRINRLTHRVRMSLSTRMSRVDSRRIRCVVALVMFSRVHTIRNTIHNGRRRCRSLSDRIMMTHVVLLVVCVIIFVVLVVRMRVVCVV